MTPGWIGFIFGVFLGVLLGFLIMGFFAGRRIERLERAIQDLRDKGIIHE